MFKVNDAVVFTENHKWFACLGYIEEIKGERIMVGVPMPEQGTAYIYCKKEDIEYIGKYPFILAEENE